MSIQTTNCDIRTSKLNFIYNESQMYEYIIRVFYNVVFLTYLRSNAAEKRYFFWIAVLQISGILIYLELRIKSSFLRIIKKLMTLQWYLDIFTYIGFNPLKLRTNQPFSFFADQSWSITAVVIFKINFTLCNLYRYLGFSYIHARLAIITVIPSYCNFNC